MTLAFLRLQTLVGLGFDTVKLGPNYRLGYGPVGICGIFGRTFVASQNEDCAKYIRWLGCSVA